MKCDAPTSPLRRGNACDQLRGRHIANYIPVACPEDVEFAGQVMQANAGVADVLRIKASIRAERASSGGGVGKCG